MTAMASIDTPQAGAALTNDFAYASAQKDGVSKLVIDKEIVTAYALDDAALWEQPNAWPQKAVEPYKEYIAAGQEVIDS